MITRRTYAGESVTSAPVCQHVSIQHVSIQHVSIQHVSMERRGGHADHLGLIIVKSAGTFRDGIRD